MNRLKPHRRVQVLSLLLEGCTLRAASRLTGAHRTTIMLLDRQLRDLSCPIVEADELWAFCRKKEHRLTPSE